MVPYDGGTISTIIKTSQIFPDYAAAITPHGLVLLGDSSNIYSEENDSAEPAIVIASNFGRIYENFALSYRFLPPGWRWR